MNTESAWNMFVFRDGRSTVPGATLARDLADAISVLPSHAGTVPHNDLINALLRAGELECALADAASPSVTEAAQITDALAHTLISEEPAHLDLHYLLQLIPAHPPAELKVSPPEGFAYYALHPLDYSDMVASATLRSDVAGVIGVRSIGVTLSALVAARLRLRGIRVVRMTVRPEGHPYNRNTQLSPEQKITVNSLAMSGAEFLIADEGPGMSGSSFLSAGDALIESGVPRASITFLCSRMLDPDTLRACNGPERWRTFRALFARKNSRLPQDALLYIGGGEWRSLLLPGGSEWPASWTQMERLKFLSPDHSTLFKFEGFGRFGKAVHERANAVASAGFGPAALDFAQGFSVYPVIPGHSMTEARATERELSAPLLRRMAAYCAFRAHEFRCPRGQDWAQMESMVRFNMAEEFGYDLPLAPGALATKSPVIVDGRMMPHEWIISPDGNFLKVDNASHGDDHFFPGPTDIAWDIAGAIVEWRMDSAATHYFIAEYVRFSGDDVRQRLPEFMMAYTVFRFGYCKMAAAALRGSAEEHRLTAAYERYRASASERLADSFEPLAA